jgi:protocatechuate 3,4-dioxygenase beta subunit
MKRLLALLLVIALAACNASKTPEVILPIETQTTLPPTPAVHSTPIDISATPTLSTTPVQSGEGDLFNQARITLPPPSCDSGLTPAQTEGPYFKAGSPERITLLEEGMQGERLILAGYVLDQDCQPIPNAMLDFWQANENGDYDNNGYTLRGHQFTDEQGRYYLETIMPGLYASRPILHIHVKVQPSSGQVLTTQIYFPEQPVENLTVTLEPREGFYVGYFNFIVQK